MTPHGEPTYREFARLVAKYPRTELLRVVAQSAAAVTRRRFESARFDPPMTSFTLAGVARTALSECRDVTRKADAEARNTRGGAGYASARVNRGHRRRRERLVGRNQLMRLCGAYISLFDPALRDDGTADVSSLLARLAFEQFGVQYSPMENLSRAHSLFVDYAAKSSAMPTPRQWESLLGVDLDSFMRTGFALHVAMLQNGGAISREVLKANHVRVVWEPLQPADLFDVVDRHFARTPEEHRNLIRSSELTGREKWSFNSLTAYPLVAIGSELVCPAPHFLLDRVTSTGLWYIAQDVWKSRFTNALGPTFEAYVGDQLRLLQHAIVHSQIRYTSAGSEASSCDWIVVTDAVIVLVEVKCARPGLDYRAGGCDGLADVREKLNEAIEQLERTAQHITARHPKFDDIPHDRPLRGLIVTLEPYHLRQTLRDDLLDSDVLPISHSWAHELETTMALLQADIDAGRQLLRALTPRDGVKSWLIDLHEGKTHHPRNPIVQASWDAWAKWPAMDRRRLT